MRLAVRNRLKIATTMGYGPRFLHSTGQLHKGGANNVLAFQITSGRAQDEPIPGEVHSFRELFRAQSVGDWLSLQQHGRRAVRVHLKNESELVSLASMFEDLLAMKSPRKTKQVGKGPALAKRKVSIFKSAPRNIKRQARVRTKRKRT